MPLSMVSSSVCVACDALKTSGESIEHVIVLERINLAGTVHPAWIVEITDPEFAEATLAAVVARRYTPAKRHGEPIVIPFTIRVDFKMH